MIITKKCYRRQEDKVISNKRVRLVHIQFALEHIILLSCNNDTLTK